MSQYLIDEINGTANIDIRHNTEVAGAEGDTQLEALVLLDNTTGITERVHASALFVLVAAEPRTDWLPDTIQRDGHGFLLTGSDLRPAWRLAAAASTAPARDQSAGRLRRRGCPSRLHQTRRLSARRRLNRRHEDDPIPAGASQP